ncbi:hypothetical protein ACKKBG_A25645 [Auxenochlorella protothecoides x Auxenochlorella symbiontica]
MLRVVRAAGLLRTRAAPSCSCAGRLFSGKSKPTDELDDASYELLPPGASMKDPLYGLSPDAKVFHHDNKQVVTDKQRLPDALPHSREAAQQKLRSQKYRKAPADDEDDRYVYLPPGSSMREPGDSMSDPGERKVYRRDPTPLPKKGE